jgi:hypothetical protein
MARSAHAWAAALVTLAAFITYASTLLPGFDFGDTASFQVMAGSASITPRDGYPLFFAIGALFTWLLGGDPAFALNVASAAAAAVSCGIIVLLAFTLTGSVPASVAAAAVFGGSYTFWSQSVIAEVYALHIGLVSATLLALLWWEGRPGWSRLALFFALYAVAFGNHLSMILLFPACAAFLLLSAPGGWRTVAGLRVVAMAAAIAALASLQYLWNLRALWLMSQPPASLFDGLGAFWFDVTKSDWRETMVLEVPASMTLERIRMYGFDVAQQFGWLFPTVALVGFWSLARQHRNRAALLALAYIVNVAFALGYSVGDSHVFFLPSHLMIALLVAPGLLYLDRLASSRGAFTGLALVLAAIHVYREYPALDRSGDLRPRQVLDALTGGLDDRNAVLFTDLNWQVQNGLTYYSSKVRTEVATARMPEVLLYAPALFQDNRAIDRDIVVTRQAREELTASYGPLFSSIPDDRAEAPVLSEAVRRVPTGTRYVLCVLRATRDFPIDQEDLARGLEFLTGGRTRRLPPGDYIAITGLVGSGDAGVIARERPFRQTTDVGGVEVELRMESWLPFDTIRRMGFGHVVAGRRHTLIVERGVSFAAFDAEGRALHTAYAANIFAPQPRWLVVPAGEP